MELFKILNIYTYSYYFYCKLFACTEFFLGKRAFVKIKEVTLKTLFRCDRLNAFLILLSRSIGVKTNVGHCWCN